MNYVDPSNFRRIEKFYTLNSEEVKLKINQVSKVFKIGWNNLRNEKSIKKQKKNRMLKRFILK